MKVSLIAIAATMSLLSTPALAAVYVVDAQANSVTGGTGVSTHTVATGDALTVSSDTNDLWSAGALPRFSDASGLTGDRLATALDDSGQPVGTLIGQDFGLWTFNGLTAPFGALVGEIGGVYQLLGANFSGSAWGDGALRLFYWDANNEDNDGSIAFDVSTGLSPIPEPATWVMLIAGFGLVGAALRSNRGVVRTLS